MNPQRPKIPAEAVDPVHPVHSRRGQPSQLSVRREALAIGGLTTTAIVEALMPNYALAQQVSREDERIAASYETLPSPDGNGHIRGYLVRPFSADSRRETPAALPGVIVIHENRGLNPHTEDVARRFALANFMAFAPDALTTVGGYPGDDYQGGQLFRGIDREKMTADFVAAGAVVEVASGLQRADRRDRVLLRWRHVQHAGRAAGCGPGGGGAVLWRGSSRGGRTEDPDGHAHSPWCARYPAGRGLSRLRGGDAGQQRHARGPHLPGLGARLLQRRHAGALQPGHGGGGLDAHDRVVQSIHA